jgi:hypothetical protein
MFIREKATSPSAAAVVARRFVRRAISARVASRAPGQRANVGYQLVSVTGCCLHESALINTKPTLPVIL